MKHADRKRLMEEVALAEAEKKAARRKPSESPSRPIGIGDGGEAEATGDGVSGDVMSLLLLKYLKQASCLGPVRVA